MEITLDHNIWELAFHRDVKDIEYLAKSLQNYMLNVKKSLYALAYFIEWALQDESTLELAKILIEEYKQHLENDIENITDELYGKVFTFISENSDKVDHLTYIRELAERSNYHESLAKSKWKIELEQIFSEVVIPTGINNSLIIESPVD